MLSIKLTPSWRVKQFISSIAVEKAFNNVKQSNFQIYLLIGSPFFMKPICALPCQYFILWESLALSVLIMLTSLCALLGGNPAPLPPCGAHQLPRPCRKPTSATSANPITSSHFLLEGLCSQPATINCLSMTR